MGETIKLLHLPNEILEKILSYLSFDEVAKNRVICRKFNVSCGKVLTRGFLNVERKHSAILKKVKSLLPRRESERRLHHLARHSDILTAIETRISMLRMTFMKYIEMNVCCFIPGKVIDEIHTILALVEGTCSPPRTHEVLQELRDISSMAMEHFDEKIAPYLKVQRTFSSYPVLSGSGLFSPTLPGLVVKDSFRMDLAKMQRRSFIQKQQISILKDLVGKLVSKVKRQSTVITTQTVKLRDQNKKIKEQDNNIADLKRHVEEWDLKFADLLAELSRARDEIPNTNSQKPVVQNTSTISSPKPHNTPPRLYKSNIKPRTAQILTNRDLERKRKSAGTSMNTVPNKVTRINFLKDDDDNSDNYVKNMLSGHDTFSRMPNFLSSSLESILRSPLTSIKSRKRKLQ